MRLFKRKKLSDEDFQTLPKSIFGSSARREEPMEEIPTEMAHETPDEAISPGEPLDPFGTLYVCFRSPKDPSLMQSLITWAQSFLRLKRKEESQENT